MTASPAGAYVRDAPVAVSIAITRVLPKDRLANRVRPSAESARPLVSVARYQPRCTFPSGVIRSRLSARSSDAKTVPSAARTTPLAIDRPRAYAVFSPVSRSTRSSRANPNRGASTAAGPLPAPTSIVPPGSSARPPGPSMPTAIARVAAPGASRPRS